MDQTSAVSQGPSVQNILSHALQPEHIDMHLISTAYINKTKGYKTLFSPLVLQLGFFYLANWSSFTLCLCLLQLFA